MSFSENSQRNTSTKRNTEVYVFGLQGPILYRPAMPVEQSQKQQLRTLPFHNGAGGSDDSQAMFQRLTLTLQRGATVRGQNTSKEGSNAGTSFIGGELIGQDWLAMVGQ